MRAVRAPELWAQGLTGEGVTVAHLDTGVDGTHPALADALQEFAEFDRLGRRVMPTPAAWDSGDHGTHTAATIAGRPCKIDGVRLNIGVAPQARLLSGMVIEGGNVIARVLGGMDWALEKKARILSMSLGLRGWMPQFQPLARRMRERGVLCVFAVGNEGVGTSRSPGNYPEVLSVGAIQPNGAVADFSSSQIFPRAERPLVPLVLGPGTGIVSAKPGGGLQSMDGTSMATPHLAGLAALLSQAKPNATVDALEAALIGASGPVQPAGRAASGLPDGLRALALL